VHALGQERDGQRKEADEDARRGLEATATPRTSNVNRARRARACARAARGATAKRYRIARGPIEIVGSNRESMRSACAPNAPKVKTEAAVSMRRL
jgi:hypothetical protein